MTAAHHMRCSRCCELGGFEVVCSLILITSDIAVSFTIGLYYLDKNVTPVIDQDAGYWMLDIGLTRYSVNLIKKDRAKR
jgi:hypothetical protein